MHLQWEQELRPTRNGGNNLGKFSARGNKKTSVLTCPVMPFQLFSLFCFTVTPSHHLSPIAISRQVGSFSQLFCSRGYLEFIRRRARAPTKQFVDPIEILVPAKEEARRGPTQQSFQVLPPITEDQKYLCEVQKSAQAKMMDEFNANSTSSLPTASPWRVGDGESSVTEANNMFRRCSLDHTRHYEANSLPTQQPNGLRWSANQLILPH